MAAMFLLKDYDTAEEVKKKFRIEQDKNLNAHRTKLKNHYNPNKVESRIEDARYLVNRYYRDNGILAIDVGTSKFVSKNMLLGEINKLKYTDDNTGYYDRKTIEAVKKIIGGLYTLEV